MLLVFAQPIWPLTRLVCLLFVLLWCLALRQENRAHHRVLCAMLPLVLLLPVASWAAPALAFLLAWPLLGAATAIAGIHAPRIAASSKRTALLLASLVGGTLLAPLVQLLYLWLTPERLVMPMMAAAIVLGLSARVRARDFH